MAPKSKRILLSSLIRRTRNMLTTYLSIIIFILGCLHVFSMNSVAMQGYLLTKEAQRSREIAMELERIDAQITQLETKEFLSKKTEASLMVYNDQKDFFVYKESYTAQK